MRAEQKTYRGRVLLKHARAQLPSHHLLPALALALPRSRLEHRLMPLNLHLPAHIKVRKVHVQIHDHILSLECLRLLLPIPEANVKAAAEELTENVSGVMEAAAAPALLLLFETLLAVAIVDLALFLIREDFVGIVDLGEFLRGLLVSGVLVRMELEGELPIGTLDLGLAGASRDGQDVIVIAPKHMSVSGVRLYQKRVGELEGDEDACAYFLKGDCIQRASGSLDTFSSRYVVRLSVRLVEEMVGKRGRVDEHEVLDRTLF